MRIFTRAPQSRECSVSDSGQHLWESWTDASMSKTWERCEACHQKRGG